MNKLTTEETEMGEVPVDIFYKLSKNRILFIDSEITDQLATDICATLLLKDNEDSSSKITLIINSPGGDIRNIFMIYDMMNIITSPIETVCIGSVSDEAVLLLSAGTPGMRFITKNSNVSLNQIVHDGMRVSDLTDAKIALDAVSKDNDNFLKALAKCINKNYKSLSLDLNRKKFLNSTQAVKYGIVDKIVQIKK